ncbi:ferredoxin [Streptomyces sp. NPDC001544]|uniref:ferredoxin n=1 Tax=Streptomyces sp. NPDC001544 TaxID=3364584 RepID=UPI003691881D
MPYLITLLCARGRQARHMFSVETAIQKSAAFVPGMQPHQGYEEALMYDPSPDDARREQVLRAAAACPVQAILVDRLEARNAPAEVSTS